MLILLKMMQMNHHKPLSNSIHFKLFTILMFVVQGHCDNSPKLSNNGIELGISPQDLSIKISEEAILEFKLSKPANERIYIILSCNDYLSNFTTTIDNGCSIIGPLNLIEIEIGQNETRVKIVGKEPGRVTILPNVNNSNIKTDAFVRLNVGRTTTIDVIGAVIGWLYFAAWSISFYPQIWVNFKRKSVIGLNFDYIGLNITGFLCYSIFNALLYSSPKIQELYEQKYPHTLIPVEINDVVFAVHAVLATLIVIIQCIVYERGDQKISILSKVFLILIWISAAVMAIIIPIVKSHRFSWLTYIYFFSYVKLAITITKYIPQAWFNYKRKSTVGWSIGNILLDLTGGSLSLLQMFLLAYNYDNWKTIFTNFTKFGLGMVSILFDILFIIQHYCLYGEASESELTSLASENRESVKDMGTFET